MTKYLLAVVTTCLFFLQTGAQPFYSVTHTSGTQTINANNVTVTSGGSAGTGANCSVGPYTVGNGGTNGSYTFAFSIPVNRLRLHVAVFHTSESYDIIINGVKHMVTTADLSTYSGSCSGTFPLPSVVNGTVINNSSTYIDCMHQTDILSVTPIDSVRIQRYASLGGYTGFDFAFRTDTIAIIDQPFIDTIKCPGDSLYVSFDALPAFATGNMYTVQLSNASGSFAAPVSIGTLAATGSGTIPCVIPANTPGGTGYRVRIISTNPVRISGDNEVNIRVHTTLNNKPVAGSNSPVCEGASLNLTSTSVGTGVNYNWTGPASFSSGQQNPSISNTTTNHSGDYIVTASLNGCSAKDTVTVLVKPTPATPTAGNNSPICSGNDLLLNAVSTTQGVTYDWSGPNSFTSTTQNPTLTGSTTGMSGVYTVTASLNGCTSGTATTTATVKQTPATPVAGSNSPVCEGGALNLAANSITGGVTYNWTGPGGFISTQQNPVINPAGSVNAGTYNVTAELNGCTSTASGSTSVIVNTVSTLGFYANPNDTLCEDKNNAIFVALPFNAGTSPQYQWYKNGSVISSATNPTYNATGIQNGDTFNCVMTVTGVCPDPIIIFSQKMGMTVLPLQGPPSVTITANPSGELSPWQLVTFTATPTNAGINPKYQWKRNGQDVTGATSNIWSANNLSNNDTVYCEITSDIWCATPAKDVSNKIVVHIKLGVDDVEVLENVQLYPNPNDGRFTMDIPPSPFKGGVVSIEIINAVGQVVYQAVATQGKTDIQLDVASGMYLLKVKADGEVKVMRFTVK